VVAIIGVCYDITKILEASGIQVYYEYGCYTITAAGREQIRSDSYKGLWLNCSRGVYYHSEGIMMLLKIGSVWLWQEV